MLQDSPREMMSRMMSRHKKSTSIVIHATYPIVKSFESCISSIFLLLFLLIMGFKIQIFERNAFEGKTNRSFFRLINTLRAEATFSQCEMASEKQPLPTTVRIRPKIWTNKLKKNGVFLFLDRFRALRLSLALVFVWDNALPTK